MTYGPQPGYRPPLGPPPGYRATGPYPTGPHPVGPYPPGPQPSYGPPGHPPPGGPWPTPAPTPPPVHGPPPVQPAPWPGRQQPVPAPLSTAPRDAAAEPPTRGAAEEVLTPRTGKVGETLEGEGSFGLRAGWRVVSVRYPADDVFVDAGLRVPDGYTSVIVGALFTNKGHEPVECVPSRGLCVVDDQGGVHLAASATVASHPGFREGVVGPEETVAGHTFYLIKNTHTVRGVQWRDGADTLTWMR